MPVEENKAKAGRLIEELWNKGNFDVMDELVNPNFVDHDPASPWVEPGSAGFKKFVQVYRSAFPDTHFTINMQVAEGDKVVTQWSATGTNRGEMMGIPATNKQATITGTQIDRFEDGKVVETWVNWDALGLMQQLGLAPTPGQ